MKLGLGTAQFGMEYGISNQRGRTSPEEVSLILDVARQNRIQYLDTAPAYGDSEDILGKMMHERNNFSVVTKTHVLNSENMTGRSAVLVENTFRRSLSRLRLASVYGLLAHRAEDLLRPEGDAIYRKMIELKKQSLVTKIGVSVYTAREIDAILDRYEIDIIQVPVNVLDQRLLVSGHLEKLKKKGIEVHARSVFLQGLLLMDADALPPYFELVREHLRRYHESIIRLGLTPLQAAIGFVAGLKQVNVVLCGVNNHNHLREICAGWKPINADEFRGYALADERFVNPSRWNH